MSGAKWVVLRRKANFGSPLKRTFEFQARPGCSTAFATVYLGDDATDNTWRCLNVKGVPAKYASARMIILLATFFPTGNRPKCILTPSKERFWTFP